MIKATQYNDDLLSLSQTIDLSRSSFQVEKEDMNWNEKRLSGVCSFSSMKPFSILVQHGPRPFLSPLSPHSSFTTKASIASLGKCPSHSPPKSPIPCLFHPCKAPFFFFISSWSFFNDRSNFVHSLYAGVESSRLSVRRCLPEKISTSFEPDRASEDGLGQIQVNCA